MGDTPQQKIDFKRLLIMKLALRIFALSVVVAGGVAAAITPKTVPAVKSHQAAMANLPVPGCIPGFPTCPTNPNGAN
jgi:hypothetical protein